MRKLLAVFDKIPYVDVAVVFLQKRILTKLISVVMT